MLVGGRITFVAGLEAVLQAFLLDELQVFLNTINSEMLVPRLEGSADCA